MSEPQPNASTSTSHTLDSYITSNKPAPEAIATSTEIRDRGSTFIANIFGATTPGEARSHVKYVKHVLHGKKLATHEVAAWRCMVLKHNRSGLGGPEDFELTSGSMDDGEKWAGDKVLKVMQNLAIIDAVVIVSRWYGGTLLGPSRFNHFETCTMEVCQVFKRSEELRESIVTLETLDILLASLREELKALQTASNPSDSQSSSEIKRPEDIGKNTEKKKVDYSTVDLLKARRLIKARENAIKWAKDSLNELRSKEVEK